MIETAKLASIFILFGLSAFSGIISCATIRCLASKLSSSSKFKRAINILNCFSGGVFFASSVLSLLPEARESMEQALEGYDVHSEYPFTELAMCIGFFLILSFEHFAHSCCSSKSDNVKQTDLNLANVSQNGTFGTDCTEPNVGYKKRSNLMPERVIHEDPTIVSNDLEDSSYHGHMKYQTYGSVDEPMNTTSVRPHAAPRRNSTSPTVREVVFQESERILIKHANTALKTGSKSTQDALEEARTSSNQDPARSRLRGLVLLIALSLHMIFEGLALGLLKESDKVWGLLVALSLHKVLVFFTIGLQILEILTSLRKTVFLILIFALVSPCGIIIGESITSADDSVTKDMISAILQGIATGTFLFVTFFDILQRELGSGDHDLLKVFSAVIGSVLVAATRLLEHGD